MPGFTISVGGYFSASYWMGIGILVKYELSHMRYFSGAFYRHPGFGGGQTSSGGTSVLLSHQPSVGFCYRWNIKNRMLIEPSLGIGVMNVYFGTNGLGSVIETKQQDSTGSYIFYDKYVSSPYRFIRRVAPTMYLGLSMSANTKFCKPFVQISYNLGLLSFAEWQQSLTLYKDGVVVEKYYTTTYFRGTNISINVGTTLIVSDFKQLSKNKQNTKKI